jgi:hypothetical protein
MRRRFLAVGSARRDSGTQDVYSPDSSAAKRDFAGTQVHRIGRDRDTRGHSHTATVTVQLYPGDQNSFLISHGRELVGHSNPICRTAAAGLFRAA